MDSRIKRGLESKFAPSEVKLIEKFLDQGFLHEGQVAIASIFLFARESEKSVADVLAQCQKEWERNWQYQHPDIKGSPDAPGGAGLQNRASLENIYKALGIASPLEAAQNAIPKGLFKIKTANSTYVLGEANEAGERTISREGKPLKFTCCRVTFLAIGKSMQIEILDGPEPGESWHTSDVASIEEASPTV